MAGLDLTEVEGLGDLINADTEAQRRQALRQFKVAGRQAETWRTRLIEALAQIEASIDFADEGDARACWTLLCEAFVSISAPRAGDREAHRRAGWRAAA